MFDFSEKSRGRSCPQPFIDIVNFPRHHFSLISHSIEIHCTFKMIIIMINFIQVSNHVKREKPVLIMGHRLIQIQNLDD